MGDGAVLGRPRPQLAILATVLVLTMATWFAASACAPALRAQWGLESWQATLLTSSVQLGFVVGAVCSAILNLPDLVDAARLVAVAAAVAAVTTVAMVLLAEGVWVGSALRFLTGVALAAVYPVGMKIASSWFQRGRGLALAVLIGALTVGSALPQLVSGLVASAWRETLTVSAGLCLAGAGIAWALVRLGPLAAPAPRFDPGYVLTLVRNRGARLSIAGYLGHMWELYAVWVWLPAFLAASLAARGTMWPGWALDVTSFLAIGACGAFGCLAAGWWGDRLGRARVASWAMVASGTCCLLASVLFGSPPVVLIPLLAVWGAAVIADSAMFSACLTSVVDPRFVGTALTIQTASGFLLTILTIEAVPLLVALSGWPLAVAVLGIGPLAGAAAMRRLAPLLPG